MEGVFGHSLVGDAVRVVKAVATNAFARMSPGAYVRWTGETGRGLSQESAVEVARYFLNSVHEYMDALGVSRERIEYWKDRRVVEYGPGDVPGVGLLLAGLGAKQVICVDRFALVRFSDQQASIVHELARLLPDDVSRGRLWSCFVEPGNPKSGLSSTPLRYTISRSGLLGQDRNADIVLSRAVLEHVNDLPATFRDVAAVLSTDGVSVHKVDLKSHGLHRRHRLDFLTWPDLLWRAMFSHKGAPNRLRVDQYRAAIERAGLVIERFEPCDFASKAEVREIRPYLATRFRELSDEDLALLSFWIGVRRPRGVSASEESP